MRKVLFLSLLLIALTGLASADNIFYTFSWSGGPQGTVDLLPGNVCCSGSGIGLDSLDVFDMTTGTDNTYAITGGALAFDPLSLAFSITGNAGAFGSGTLLSGLITGGSITGCNAGSGTCDLNLNGTSNLGLAMFFVKSQSANGTNPWTAFSQSVTTELVTTTPEPASLGLLASGLVFVGGSLRRKLRKQ